jgi:DNA-binding CsgD family transcriptional regulator
VTLSDPVADPVAMTRLTGKQKEVLNHLIEHKTSKEISRILGISPHTVDQRIDTARSKLGLASRGELALAWRRHLELTDSPVSRMTHESSGIGDAHSAGADRARGSAVPNHAGAFAIADEGTGGFDHRVGPELFEGRWGTLARLGAIFTIAALFLLVVLIGFGVFVSISELMPG